MSDDDISMTYPEKLGAALQVLTAFDQNGTGTSKIIGTPVTRLRSRPVRNKLEDGVVYFVRAGDAIKIGFTTNMENRLSQLQCSNPNLVEVLFTFPGTMDDEIGTMSAFGTASQTRR